MPKQLTPDLLERVTALLHEQPQGLTLAELETSLRGVASRRSLQRRIDRWTRQQAIRAEGIRRGRRYFETPAPGDALAVQPPTGALNVTSTPAVVAPSIPISTAGREIQEFVRRPLTDRPPVGYEQAFLQGYAPNETAYLPEIIRTHLQELGSTPDGNRPAGTYARDILNRLLIDLSWSSSRLEGNTYSLLDTRELIDHGTAAAGKDAKETQMILNHKAAIELLVDSAAEVGVNRYTITNLHAILADNLLDDPRTAGRLRTTPVVIGASTYVPTAIPQLIEQMFNRLVEIGGAIRNSFEQSFFLMVHLPYLQPFVDVNKRTSRLAANIPLIRRNLVPMSFLDVPEQTYIDGLIGIYELRRIELLRDLYVWAYERSARQYKTVRDSLPEPDPFRLKYRNALTEIVGDIVRRRMPQTEVAIAESARPMVEATDVPVFTQMVLREIGDLHEGNIARYRIRPSEFQQWRAQARAVPPG
jgi:fido (protein-threonine AMPylation protein)